MGVLYAKVAGQWVPIAPAGTVAAPAQVGPRSDSPGEARFGNLAQPGNVGFFAGANGNNYIIGLTGAAGLEFLRVDPGSQTYTLYATLKTPYSTINGWDFGINPGHGLYGIWRDGENGSGQYRMLLTSGTTIINGEGAVELRANNASVGLEVIAGRVTNRVDTHHQGYLDSYKDHAGDRWDGSQIRIRPASNQARIAFNASGVAPNIRGYTPQGDAISFLDQLGSSYCGLHAGAYNVSSSLTIKRDIRPLRVVPEQVTTYLDPMLDEVPEPDVMALRPVAFRPKNPAYRLTEDDESVPRDPDTWLGHEGLRERLGLIAEEVEHVIPSAVAHDDYGATLGIDYAQITVALLDHVQQLTETVATLQARITELEKT